MHVIARELNKSGVPTRRKARTADGGYWRPAAVRNLLSNSIYKGVFIWNDSTTAKARAKNEGRDLEPMHYLRPELRLVSDELWDRCNDKTISRSGYGGGKHALAGLVSCGCCHGTLVLSSVSRCRSLYCANCTVAKSSDGQKQRLTQTIATVGVQTLLVESARHFLSEDFVAAFRDALRRRLVGGNQAELDSARAELRKLERAQTRLLNIQNMWLAARAEGIGLGWVSIFDPVALAELLGMPAGARPVAILCIGHVEAFYPRPMLEIHQWAERMPLETVVFENGWRDEAPAPAGG